MTWRPTFGATHSEEGTHFRVWAPDRREVEVILEEPGDSRFRLTKQPDGCFHGVAPQVTIAQRYRYLVDGPGRQRFAGAQVTLAAKVEVDRFVGEILELRDGLENFEAFGGHFRTRAIAADNGDA